MWSSLFIVALLFVGTVYCQDEAFDLGFDVPNPTKLSRHNITAKDGINLEAIVFDTRGKTKNPAIVFISSWGLNKYEYLYPAKQYSDLGYTVFFPLNFTSSPTTFRLFFIFFFSSSSISGRFLHRSWLLGI